MSQDCFHSEFDFDLLWLYPLSNCMCCTWRTYSTLWIVDELSCYQGYDTTQGGGGLPYLKLVENLHMIDPSFWHFPILIVWLNSIPLTPSFCIKICLFLSHIVPKIIGPNVGLIFHQNLSFLQFSIWFLFLLTHFHCF